MFGWLFLLRGFIPAAGQVGTTFQTLKYMHGNIKLPTKLHLNEEPQTNISNVYTVDVYTS